MSYVKIFGWILMVGLAVGLIIRLSVGNTGSSDIYSVAGLALGIPVAYMLFVSSASPVKKLLGV